MAIQFLLPITLVLLVIQQAYAQVGSLASPGCQEACGNITIPYPFGIGANCSGDEPFTVICYNSFNPPRPFLNKMSLEVLEISLEAATVRVNNPVFTSTCQNRTTKGLDVSLSRPFTFSATQNRFTAMGCDSHALIIQHGLVIGGCTSFCNSTSRKNSCYGVNCCQTRIPPSLRYINASFRDIDPENDQHSCKYAFIVDQNWFGNLTNMYGVESMEQVPVVLDWRTYGTCKWFRTLNASANRFLSLCAAYYSECSDGLCTCAQGYEGNPYLPDGCQEIDICSRGNICCREFEGDLCPYYCQKNTCYTKSDGNRARMAIIGTCSGLGGLCLIIASWWLYKVTQRRKERKLKEKFFKKNGGLLLQQQVSSGEGNVEKSKLFTSKELEKATDQYNEDRILGQGGQGTVYKGMLTDGSIVAVKKSKIVKESKIDHFINEVVILSQINHRNIVRLHRCCLETEVPLLVYEFIPNGTLFQYIHDQNEEFPLYWDVRVRVATEVAGALFYLHSAASIPIYHRDIKSSNILLDDKYKAKVADFGTSRSIAIDQTHLTTRVHGTFGYLDPEYFQSSQFTDKSDVYSFGVVLVELLTGQKPILPARSDDEGRSLATLFILAMEENRLFDILDARVMNEGGKEEITRFANLAYRCLNLNGRKRPTMKQVATELDGIRMSHGASTGQQHYEQVENGVAELIGNWDSISTSMDSSGNNSVSVDIDPLLGIKYLHRQTQTQECSHAHRASSCLMYSPTFP